MFTIDRVIAHRGASAYAPENTLAAFQKAAALGCHWVEFDVMLNADHEAFVFHDTDLQRVTNGHGEFGLATTAYLQSLDCGSWFGKGFQQQKIVPFHEMLQWLNQNNMHANIEIKPYTGMVTETTRTVLSELHRHWPKEKNWPLVSSFEYGALQLCRDIIPDLPLGLLLADWQEDWLKLAQAINCYSIHLSCRIITPARIQAIKQQGFKILVYTVNQRKLAQKLFACGVDAIFSDYPDIMSLSISQKLLARLRN